MAAVLPPATPHLPLPRSSRSALGQRLAKGPAPTFICPIDGPLAYSDEASDSVVFPAAISGGTGLKIGGGTLIAGAVNTAAPVTGYVDWLAQDGSLLGGGTTPPATWFYERVWQVTCAVAPCSDISPVTGVKQITITSTVRSSVGHALIPKSTVTTLKASQF